MRAMRPLFLFFLIVFFNLPAAFPSDEYSVYSKSDLVAEETLRSGEVISIQRNKEKTTSDTYWVVLRNPKTGKSMTALFKPENNAKPSDYRAEESAYRYDRIFNFHLVPVTIVRALELDGSGTWIQGTLQQKLEIHKPWTSSETLDTALKNEFTENQFYTIRLFHHLIYNKDVNILNIQSDKEGHLISLDHEFAFGYMDPFGAMEPRHVHAFPKNLDFNVFAKYYEQLSSLSDEEYAEMVAPLVAYAQGADPDNLDRYMTSRLNWIMGFLMEARQSFLLEMQLRVSDLDGHKSAFYNLARELLPYRYFTVSQRFAKIDMDDQVNEDARSKSKKKKKKKKKGKAKFCNSLFSQME